MHTDLKRTFFTPSRRARLCNWQLALREQVGQL
jgi:hypothetical protein